MKYRISQQILGSKSIGQMLEHAVSEYANLPFQHYRSNGSFTSRRYRQVYEDIKCFAHSLQLIGVKKGSKVAMLSDNRYEWLICDLALLMLGAVTVPRSSQSPVKELSFLIKHSDSEYIITERESLVDSLETDIPPSHIICIEENSRYNDFNMMIEQGDTDVKLPKTGFEDLATIIYTSGTTGNPKGVMLTHGNLMHNVRCLTPLLNFEPFSAGGERILAVLPTWHIFERMFEYCSIAGGAEISYTNLKHFAQDIRENAPTAMSAVPRIWESIYAKVMDNVKSQSLLKRWIFKSSIKMREWYLHALRVITFRNLDITDTSVFLKILRYMFYLISMPLLIIPGHLSYYVFAPVRKAVGGRMRGAFTGGGTLPPYVDLFFNSAGVTLINAYGMTETSPGITGRRFERNILFTVGRPFDETQIRLCDEEGERLNMCRKGTIFVKGPQVMKGYYNNADATRKVLSEDGWLNTGDLGMLTMHGDLMIVGRAKDTIVLLSGENIEPSTLEQRLEESEYISHAVIVGNDKKHLGALVVLEEEKIKHKFDEWNEEFKTMKDAIYYHRTGELIREQIQKLINESREIHPFERIKAFQILPEKFTIDNELTRTLKKKRDYIVGKYDEFINRMFRD